MSRMIKPNAHEISAEKLAELKATASKILADVRMAFLRQQPFTGSVSMSLNLIPTRDSRNPTAATDGNNLYFDIAFLSELSASDRMFILGHEVYHNIMLHFLRQEGRDRELWNIATDMEVNCLLKSDGMEPPTTAVMPNKYGIPKEGLSAEEYYEILVARQKNLPSNSPSKNENDSANGGSPNTGSGDSNASVKQNSQNNSGNKDGKLEGQFDKHIYEDDEIAAEEGPSDQADKYGKVGHDADFQPKAEAKTIEKIREAAVSAAQQIERQRGELPAHLQRIVKGMLEPKVDWKEKLAAYVTRCLTNDPTWNRPNRRFAHNGTYLPGHEGKEINVAVILDTSGSTVVDANRFLTELNGIIGAYDQFKATVIHCDAQVQHVDEFSSDMPMVLDAAGYEFHGGGGTRLQPAFDYLDVNDVEADVIIVFTDGYHEKFTADKAPDCPTLWLITKDGRKDMADFGEIIDFT